MTDNEYYEAIGYLSARNLAIHAEVAETQAAKFENYYFTLTGVHVSNLQEYYKIFDKWGKELRLYISNTDNIPGQLASHLTSDTYKGYAGRINYNDLIMRMFENGFRVGSSQNLTQIKATIPPIYQADFDRGFLL